MCSSDLTLSEHDGIRDRHPLHLRCDRDSWLIRCDSDDSRPTQVSSADDNLVRGDALRGGTAEKRTSGLARVRKLDRSHDRVVGNGGFSDLDAALHRGLGAIDISDLSAPDLKLPCPHILTDLENRSLVLWLNPIPQAALA